MKDAMYLLDKTDADLIAMARELATELDFIGQEQMRRLAAANRQRHAVQDDMENEGASSPARPPR